MRFKLFDNTDKNIFVVMAYFILMIKIVIINFITINKNVQL